MPNDNDSLKDDVVDTAASGDVSGNTEKIDPLVELKKITEALTNMKSEFNRKIDGIKQSGTHVPPPVVTEKKSLKDLWYEDEEKAFDALETRMTEKFEQRLSAKDKQASVAGELVRDFPEITDKSNPLTKRANEIFASFSEEDARSPLAMRMAVSQAALELSVMPTSKRRTNDDGSSGNEDFSGLGNRGGNSSGGNGRRGKSLVTPEMIEIAQLSGLNTDDPAVMKRLEQRASRTNYKKFQ